MVIPKSTIQMKNLNKIFYDILYKLDKIMKIHFKID